MKVYAVMRRWARGQGSSAFHVYKLYDSNALAQSWIDAKNPNACSYEYAVMPMKVESSLPTPATEGEA